MKFASIVVIACAYFGACLGGAELACSQENGGQLRPVAKGDDGELRYWLENMVRFHRYSVDEVKSVLGLSEDEIKSRLAEWKISAEDEVPALEQGKLRLLPYPGGRHPRIGFLDGAVEPQRETKLSVFTPWDRSSYVVADFPEAIWSNLGLTYLAHTHVETVWDKQGVKLNQLEWKRGKDLSYSVERTLPNGIRFSTTAKSHADHIEWTMTLFNGTKEPLSDLRVQNCVMLKGAKDFDQQSNDNKFIQGRFVACHNSDKTKWIISGWSPIHRPWANPPCPCLHADPKFADLKPGESSTLHGWLSFYQGTDIEAELKRIDATKWFEGMEHAQK